MTRQDLVKHFMGMDFACKYPHTVVVSSGRMMGKSQVVLLDKAMHQMVHGANIHKALEKGLVVPCEVANQRRFTDIREMANCWGCVPNQDKEEKCAKKFGITLKVKVMLT